MFLRLVANSLLTQYIGKVAGLLCSFATIAIITRHLGASSYGDYTAALAVASLAITLSDFGFFWSTIHSLGGKTDKNRIASELIGMKLVATLLILLIFGVVVALGSFSPSVKGLYVILSIFILSSSINSVLVAIYQNEYKMLWPTAVDVFMRLIGLVLVIIGVRAGYGLPFFIAAASLTALLGLAINWFGLMRVTGRIVPKIFGYRWSDYYQSVFLLGLIQIFYLSFYRVDVVILSALKPSEDVGIYGVVMKVIEVVVMLSSLFVGALFPVLVRYYGEDKQRFIKYIHFSLMLLFSLGWPILVFGQWFTREVIGIVGGSGYLDISTVAVSGHIITPPMLMSLGLLFCLLNYLSVIFYTGLLAARDTKALLVINLAALSVSLVLNFSLASRYSYFGTMSAAVIAEALLVSATASRYVALTNYRLDFVWLAKIVVASLPGVALLLSGVVHNIYLGVTAALMLYVLALRLIAWPAQLKINEIFRQV